MPPEFWKNEEDYSISEKDLIVYKKDLNCKIPTKWEEEGKHFCQGGSRFEGRVLGPINSSVYRSQESVSVVSIFSILSVWEICSV